MSVPKKKEKKKGVEPSKEEAELAIQMIKLLQEKGDINTAEKNKKEQELKKQQELARAEALRVQIAQEQVKRKLKENLRKKEVEKKKTSVINFLESASVKESKIKWKTIDGGRNLLGYIENKLVFEIKRGMTLFSLYVKDKNIMKKRKLTSSYISCSTNLLKLKRKSDKLI